MEFVMIGILGLALYAILLHGLERINKSSKEIVQRLDLLLESIKKGRS